MNVRNKWTMGLLSLGAAAILGVSATAVYAQTATPTQTPVAGQARLDRAEDHSALLAEVLGISEEELQAAITTVRDAAIDQAVTDGRITQEQADEMKANEDTGRGRWGVFGRGDTGEAALAEALGITVDELQTAKDEVQQRLLDEAVAAGEITQEQADLMVARQAFQEYQQELRQSEMEAALAQAVTDGVITQEQADLLLSEQGAGGFFGPGMDGGRRGGRGHGGPGGDFGGLGGDFGRGHGERGDFGRPGQSPDETPAQPDSEQPEESGGSVVPSGDINL